MNVFRRLERRLESLLDGAVAGVFRGALHPTELAGRLTREADLASTTTDIGPVVPNHYRLVLAPEDMAEDTPVDQLTRWLAAGMERFALDRGWRMDGPATVELVSDPQVSRGSPHVDTDSRNGTREPWASLHGDGEIPIPVNRAILGRGEAADVEIPDDTVSRRHALLWTERDMLFVQDLGSANGTRVDGEPVGKHPIELPEAGRLTLGESSFIVRRR